jgi:hypothetical protein
MPPVTLTNKKDVFTKDGIYHNTAADSNSVTDIKLRRYKIEVLQGFPWVA